MTDEDKAKSQTESDATQPDESVSDATEEPVEVEAEVAPESGAVCSDDVGPEPEEAQEQAVDPLEAALEENKKTREQMLRLAADFDNFRKRARRENEDAARRAKIDVLRELLPVFDNMERAGAHAGQAADVKAVAMGVEMVVKQFLDVVGKLGVERIQAMGEAFDPNVHEAIQQIETADQTPGTVVAELLPGYLWGERLLRAAMVVVAKAPPEKPAEEASEEASEEVQPSSDEPGQDASADESTESAV